MLEASQHRATFHSCMQSHNPTAAMAASLPAVQGHRPHKQLSRHHPGVAPAKPCHPAGIGEAAGTRSGGGCKLVRPVRYSHHNSHTVCHSSKMGQAAATMLSKACPLSDFEPQHRAIIPNYVYGMVYYMHGTMHCMYCIYGMADILYIFHCCHWWLVLLLASPAD